MVPSGIWESNPNRSELRTPGSLLQELGERKGPPGNPSGRRPQNVCFPASLAAPTLPTSAHLPSAICHALLLFLQVQGRAGARRARAGGHIPSQDRPWTESGEGAAKEEPWCLLAPEFSYLPRDTVWDPWDPGQGVTALSSSRRGGHSSSADPDPDRQKLFPQHCTQGPPHKYEPTCSFNIPFYKIRVLCFVRLF